MSSDVGTSTAAPSKTGASDEKILQDLGVLKEKMDLCDTMLNPGAADPKLSLQSEAMLAVIGFLEACAPRVVDLVEAAAAGALSEEIFAECLSCNDRLQKLLADVETAAMTETNATTTAASAPAAAGVAGQFEDLLLGDTTTPSGNLPDEGADSKKPAASNDDFDAFFTERTTPN